MADVAPLDTTLLNAIRNNDMLQVQQSLLAGASTEACGADGSRPLVLAAKKGLENIVNLLLEAGADPNQISLEGKGTGQLQSNLPGSISWVIGPPACVCGVHKRTNISENAHSCFVPLTAPSLTLYRLDSIALGGGVRL